jgi:antitoxin StbD
MKPGKGVWEAVAVSRAAGYNSLRNANAGTTQIGCRQHHADTGVRCPVGARVSRLIERDQIRYVAEHADWRLALSTVVTAIDVQKNFGAYHDLALAEPVRVTKYGRETVHIVSAKTFHAMKQAQREAIASTDLSDAELALIEAAEIPEEYRYHLDPQG